jgi:hypothetical protein
MAADRAAERESEGESEGEGFFDMDDLLTLAGAEVMPDDGTERPEPGAEAEYASTTAQRKTEVDTRLRVPSVPGCASPLYPAARPLCTRLRVPSVPGCETGVRALRTDAATAATGRGRPVREAAL